MSTALVVSIVIGLLLLGIGMVINQLLRLRKYLREPPPVPPGDEEHPKDPGPPDQYF